MVEYETAPSSAASSKLVWQRAGGIPKDSGSAWNPLASWEEQVGPAPDDEPGPEAPPLPDPDDPCEDEDDGTKEPSPVPGESEEPCLADPLQAAATRRSAAIGRAGRTGMTTRAYGPGCIFLPGHDYSPDCHDRVP
jgi:hypothetical protein